MDSDTAEMNENDALYYTVRVGETPHSNSLKIDRDGVATFLSTKNFLPGAPPEVGSYAVALAEDRVMSLWQTVEVVSFAEMDTTGFMPDEGEGTRVITVVRDNKTTAKMVGQRDAAPPGFRELEEKFRSVVREVRQSPVSAIRLGVQLSQTGVRQGDALQMLLSWSNPGKESIHFANPFWVETLTVGFFELDGLRSDVPLLDLRDEHHFTEKLTRKCLTEARPGKYEDREVLELPAGQSIDWTLEVPIRWPAGEYSLHVLYDCNRDSVGTSSVFKGGIDSVAFTVTIAN